MLPTGVYVFITCLVAAVALAVAVILCTRAQHDKRSKAESPKLKAPDTDTSPPVQEVLSVESERTKVIMVPNTAYNFFRSNSYVFHAESVGLQTLTLERKQAKPKLSQSQPAEDRGEPLKLPPRIKRATSRPLPSYFNSEEEFQRASGWFTPSLEEVICTKLCMGVEEFRSTGHGVYFMSHAKKERAKYAGWSHSLHTTLLGLIHGLYVKGRWQHNALQTEILCHCPLAEDWSIAIWPCKKEDLLLEHAKTVIKYKCLRPCGLNKLIACGRKREGWDEFCTWYMAYRQGHE